MNMVDVGGEKAMVVRMLARTERSMITEVLFKGRWNIESLNMIYLMRVGEGVLNDVILV